MKEAKRLNVSGNVQGVGFRYFAQMTAVEHDITGWAQNLDNGTVAIHAEGSPENLERFIRLLKKGNLFAKVHNLHEESAPLEQSTTFRIK
ncbi:acylphosphatase [Domibacillus epiphyticus]|uniref:Acylphosphatase n=1 Tax=Domibacillus epiphyticus TaxID=1714355 RepID=A0A1V2ABN3_9BACI|nr:acylphosphatase [Domibacillus epiphyticus]OMP68403.1 hypothetical protein BTO28_01935 [Domibacillus epiphyticus]